MRRMLEEFYYGNINPNERVFIKDSIYSRAVQTLSENEEKLTELLEGKEKRMLLELINAQNIVDGTTAVESFIHGFRLGARIAIEIMNDEDGCLREIT